MNYLPAQIEDMDTAGNFICGVKFWIEQFDWLTVELSVYYVEALDVTDE
jgi:hypothetical protein